LNVPYNEEFEKALIVGVLSDPSLLPKVTMILEAKDFYREKHRDIFEAITEIDLDNLDSLAVQNILVEQDTKDYFRELVQDSDSLLPGLSNILYYAETIKAKSRLRAGIELGREIAAICYQENIDAEEAQIRLETMFSNFLKTRVAESTNESTEEAFAQFMETLGVRVHDTSGTRTGYRQIDLILHKLEGLLILAGRPGLGKTAFAVNIARHVAEDKNVLFFSLEQPREQIFERILAAESGVGLEDIRTGVFVGNEIHVTAIAAAKDNLQNVFQRLTIDDTPAVSASYIASVARQKYFEQGEIGLIIIDYLHIMKLNPGNLVETLGEAVKELRALGRELNCPVLLLSQLSRQPDNQTGETGSRVRRRPELTDLRSSGEIEQSADVVIFLHRDSYYSQDGYTPDEDNVEVHIKKNRNGRLGVVQLTWYPRIMRYANQDMFAFAGDDTPW
jgi:replicative DNA helicase